jgi:hypothetical protein
VNCLLCLNPRNADYEQEGEVIAHPTLASDEDTATRQEKVDEIGRATLEQLDHSQS